MAVDHLFLSNFDLQWLRTERRNKQSQFDMRKRTNHPFPSMLRRCILGALLTGVVLLGGAPISADEPSKAFLTALREAGFFDQALRYLEHSAGPQSRAPQSFRKTIPFEKAQTLIDSTRFIRKPDEQAARLDEADKLLSQYAKSIKDPVKSIDILKRQSFVRYLRGRGYLEQAGQPKMAEDRKKELTKQAKDILGLAITQYRNIKKNQSKLIDDFVVDPQDKKSYEKRKALRTDYVFTSLRVPEVMEQYALTLSGKEKQKAMKEAAVEFEAVSDKYQDDFGSGQLARAYSARCYQISGDSKKAAELVKEVFEYGRPSKRLQKVGLEVGVEVWPNLEKYPFDTVISSVERPLSTLDRREKKESAWLRIQLELARAYHAKSKASKKPKEVKAFETKASQLARELSRSNHPWREEAAKLFKELGGVARVPVPNPTVKPIVSFDEARTQGKALVGDLQELLRESVPLERALARLPDGPEREKKQGELDGIRQSINDVSSSALQTFGTGITLIQPDTNPEDVSEIRYLQSFCLYSAGKYPEAAVIGKFLLRKYPTRGRSELAAGLMVSSYKREYDLATPEQKPRLYSRLIESAISVLDQWPTGSAAGKAGEIATEVAFREQDFKNANALFDRIPADSSRRNALASSLGQQVWNTRTKVDPAQKKTIVLQAEKYLDIAVAGSDAASMEYPFAISSLYRIDAKRELGKTKVAASQAEKLIKAFDSNPVLQGKPKAKFRRLTYNSAIGVYLSAMQKDRSKAQKWIAKIGSAVEKMKKEATGDPGSQRLINSAYRRIGRDLLGQFDTLQSQAEKEQFADSIVSFFGGLGQTKDASTLLWSGSTLLGISESLKDAELEEKAREVSTLAITNLEAAAAVGFGDNKAQRLRHQQQLALAQRASGKYQESVESFKKILEESNGLSFQLDAAKTLYLWGDAENDATPLIGALNGTGKYMYKSSKTGKERERNRIWGWNRMVDQTRKDPKYREEFRESLYYSVLTRLRYGEIKQDAKAINSAKKQLKNALQRFDDLKEGGWESKYEQLETRIEKAAP